MRQIPPFLVSALCLLVLWSLPLLAEVELNPATINLQSGGIAARANWIRLQMVTVNGATGGYILAPGHGPQEGYIGEMNTVTNTQMATILNANNISDCASIPTTGTLSGTVTDDGEDLTLSLAFAEGTVEIPSFYENGGTTLAKRITVTEENEVILAVELTCAGTGDLTTMYLIYPVTNSNSRAREVYYQKNATTGKTLVDTHMTYAPDSEKYAFRFEYLDGIAKVWKVRAITDATTSSGVAAVINTATGVVHSRWLPQGVAATDTTVFTGGTEFCLDLSTNATSTDCASQSLEVANPSQTVPVNSTQHDFTYSSISQMTIGAIAR